MNVFNQILIAQPHLYLIQCKLQDQNKEEFEKLTFGTSQKYVLVDFIWQLAPLGFLPQSPWPSSSGLGA